MSINNCKLGLGLPMSFLSSLNMESLPSIVEISNEVYKSSHISRSIQVIRYLQLILPESYVAHFTFNEDVFFINLYIEDLLTISSYKTGYGAIRISQICTLLLPITIIAFTGRSMINILTWILIRLPAFFLFPGTNSSS